MTSGRLSSWDGKTRFPPHPQSVVTQMQLDAAQSGAEVHGLGGLEPSPGEPAGHSQGQRAQGRGRLSLLIAVSVECWLLRLCWFLRTEAASVPTSLD